MNKAHKQNGFTIIEVLIVLAIAALILLIMFIMLPHVRQLQRNTQRKNDLGRIIAIMDDYAIQNGGYPDDAAGGPVDNPLGSFRLDYIDNQHLIDPSNYNDSSPDGSYDFEDPYSHPLDGTGMPFCGNPKDIGTIFYTRRSNWIISMRMCTEGGQIDYTNQ